jgi:ribosomal protein S6
MRKYELVVVLRPSLKEADRKKLLETVKGWLGEEVKVVKEDDWGQKALSYEIKKENAGYYYMWQLETTSDAAGIDAVIPQGFETNLLRNDSIIRHLLLRTK